MMPLKHRLTQTVSQHCIWTCEKNPGPHLEPRHSAIQASTSKQTDNATALRYDMEVYHACNPYTNGGGASPSKSTLRTVVTCTWEGVDDLNLRHEFNQHGHQITKIKTTCERLYVAWSFLLLGRYKHANLGWCWSYIWSPLRKPQDRLKKVKG